MNGSRREVVVTGIGAVSPFGVGVAQLWQGVSAGQSGINWIRSLGDLDPQDYPVRFGGEVSSFDIDKLLTKHCEVRVEKSVQMGLVAAQEALQSAGLLESLSMPTGERPAIATIVGSGHGPCREAEAGYEAYFTRGSRAMRPTTIPKSMFNSLSSQLSIHFGLTGANHVVASACSSGLTAIGLGLLLIRQGWAEIVLCGGADAPFAPVTFAAWTSLRVLARHPEPTKASRPFDARRNGLVLGEGAAMVVLESRESADRRGVQPLANIPGFGTSSDAHHITAPTVAGQVAAMRACLADAALESAKVDYINLHGTATRANDECEATAVAAVFGARGEQMPASSTKSMLGHSLGASGAIEFVICVEVLHRRFVPPTINCDEPDPNAGLDYVPLVGRNHQVRIAMSNSFAFGGNNACVLLGLSE
jgi:3-oxoacyl-[acyl-carrier-protein] synthase II